MDDRLNMLLFRVFLLIFAVMKEKHFISKIFYSVLIIISTSLLLTSCGEDRTHEFDELVSPNPWIYKIMTDNYLYYKDIKEPKDADYFKKSPDFFEMLLSDKDGKNGNPFSYVQKNAITKSVVSNLSYGWELKYIRMNKESTNIAVQVQYVYPSSPAALAGLKRGDIFIQRNNEQYTQSNYMNLSKETTAATLTMLDGTTKKSLSSATNATFDPLIAHKIINNNGSKIGYICYTKFIVDSGDSSDKYINNLINTIGTISKQNINDLILDLRYNRGGDIVAAQKLSTILVPEKALGKELFHIQYNDKQKKSNTTYLAEKSFLNGQSNLKANRIYIITSTSTASASELVINSIIPYIGKDHIILIGETTYGKHTVMQGYTNSESPEYTFWPVVGEIYNSENTADYDSGFTPDYNSIEPTSMTLEELGSNQEWYIKNILSLINSGNLINTDTDLSNSQSSLMGNQPIYANPIEQEPLPLKVGI